jgi:hypothetical protein
VLSELLKPTRVSGAISLERLESILSHYLLIEGFEDFSELFFNVANSSGLSANLIFGALGEVSPEDFWSRVEAIINSKPYHKYSMAVKQYLNALDGVTFAKEVLQLSFGIPESTIFSTDGKMIFWEIPYAKWEEVYSQYP